MNGRRVTGIVVLVAGAHAGLLTLMFGSWLVSCVVLGMVSAAVLLGVRFLLRGHESERD